MCVELIPLDVVDPMADESRGECLMTSAPIQVSMGKRQRGRPRKHTVIQPSAQGPSSVPLDAHVEAMNTWNVAKSFGISCAEDTKVLHEIRKSKRLLLLEANDS
jgi:AT-hook transcription factor